MITLKELEAMSASQLAAWHNQHSDKHVKKFENRAAAMKRCMPIFEELKAKQPAPKPEPVKAAQNVASAPAALSEPSRFTGRNSLGVAASWADPGVYAARTKRDGVRVTVEGVKSVHKSTAAGFKAHGLPMEKHIRFRLALKQNGNAEFRHNGKIYRFEIYNEDKAQ